MNSLGKVVCTTGIFREEEVAACLRFATSNRIRKPFYHHMLLNGHVERVSLGIYKITSMGEKLLEVLN